MFMGGDHTGPQGRAAALTSGQHRGDPLDVGRHQVLGRRRVRSLGPDVRDRVRHQLAREPIAEVSD